MPREASDIKVMGQEEADENCPVKRGFVGADCEVCKNRVILHCERCEQHMTHCTGTIDDMRKRHLEAAREEEEQKANTVEERLRLGGVWVPGQ